LVTVLWASRSSTDPARNVKQVTPYHRAFLFLIKKTVTIATRVLSCGRVANLLRRALCTVLIKSLERFCRSPAPRNGGLHRVICIEALSLERFDTLFVTWLLAPLALVGCCRQTCHYPRSSYDRKHKAQRTQTTKHDRLESHLLDIGAREEQSIKITKVLRYRRPGPAFPSQKIEPHKAVLKLVGNEKNAKILRRGGRHSDHDEKKRAIWDKSLRERPAPHTRLGALRAC
jgi:hypothetical protein